MKALRIAGIVLGAFVLVAGLLAAVAVAFGPGYVKSELAQLVQQKKQRTLRIDSLTISLSPRLVAELRGLSLSERGSAEEFAHADTVRLVVDAHSLLSPPLMVQALEIGGLKATVIRRKDGTLNIDDLIASNEPPGAPLQLDVAGIHIAGAAIDWRDEKSGDAMSVADIDLSSSRIRADTGKSEFRIDNLTLSGKHEQAAAGLALTGVQLTPQALAMEKLALKFGTKNGDTAVEAAFETPLAVDFATHALSMDKIAGSVTAIHPRLAKPMHLPVSGNMRADFARQSAHGEFTTRFEESAATLKFDLARLAPLALDFVLDVDHVDLDKSLVPAKSEANGESAGLALPRDMRLAGTLRIGSLAFAGIKATNVRFHVTSVDGRVDIAPQSGGRRK